jgi:hypothetical protein
MTRSEFPLDREMCGRLLAEPDTSSTALHLILLTEFGDDLYGDEDSPAMDPVLIWRLVRERFSVTVPEENENKINAMMLGVSTDVFYEDPQAFIAISMALYSGDLGDIVSGIMEDPTLNELLWGIFEVALNRDDDMEFSESIHRVIQAETEAAVEEDMAEFAYFERNLIAGKTKILDELAMMGAPAEVVAQVRNFDATPIHNERGDIVSPNGSIVMPWG